MSFGRRAPPHRPGGLPDEARPGTSSRRRSTASMCGSSTSETLCWDARVPPRGCSSPLPATFAAPWGGLGSATAGSPSTPSAIVRTRRRAAATSERGEFEGHADDVVDSRAVRGRRQDTVDRNASSMGSLRASAMPSLPFQEVFSPVAFRSPAIAMTVLDPIGPEIPSRGRRPVLPRTDPCRVRARPHRGVGPRGSNERQQQECRNRRQPVRCGGGVRCPLEWWQTAR